VVLDLTSTSPVEAIEALVAAISPEKLTPGIDTCALVTTRERQLSTDIGHGVAIPHARCRGLPQPIIVFGRAREGIVFNDRSPEPVRHIFLLLTPAERPNLQVFFLAEIANVARSELVRERLCRAESAEELVEILSAADSAVTG
jgi:mannitol/fructose-specific phosphotransferase system IIA component (Ntr-type)